MRCDGDLNNQTTVETSPDYLCQGGYASFVCLKKESGMFRGLSFKRMGNFVQIQIKIW